MNEVEESIYEVLTADATLVALLATPTSVHAYQAPDNAALPVVVFNEQADTPRYVLTGKAADNTLYTVKGIAKGPSMKRAGEIAERIEVVLHDAALAVDGKTTLYLRKEQGVRYTEASDGVRYNHAGGTYRVVVR